MLSDKNHIFLFLKEEKVAFNEKKKNGYLKIFIIKICFIYVKKEKQASTHLKK